MKTLTISGKEYKIKFGYNSFCDSDLMERTQDVMSLITGKSGNDFAATASKLFNITRELLFKGFQKYNPVDTLEEIGDLLDTYADEAPENEERGLLQVFAIVTEELTDEGFFGSLMKNVAKTVEKAKEESKKKK